MSALVLAIALMGCGSDDSAAESDTSRADVEGPIVEPIVEPIDVPIDVPIDSADPGAGEPLSGEVPEELLERLVADAIERTGSRDPGIVLVLAEVVTWNDGSLGCPQPGGSYTQALVDGYRVVFETPEGVLDYRTAGVEYFVVCDP